MYRGSPVGRIQIGATDDRAKAQGTAAKYAGFVVDLETSEVYVPGISAWVDKGGQSDPGFARLLRAVLAKADATIVQEETVRRDGWLRGEK